MVKKNCFLILLLVLLVSCVSIGNSELKKPDSVICNIDEYQLIYGKLPYLEEEMTFEAWTRVSEDKVELSLFLPTGQTFLKTFWDGKLFEYKSDFAENGQIFAKTIINNFIDCYSTEQSGSIIEVRGKGYSYNIETL